MSMSSDIESDAVRTPVGGWILASDKPPKRAQMSKMQLASRLEYE